jgi:hypothetical protein
LTGQGREHFEIPPEMRSAAATSFRQAREAFEMLVVGAEAAAGSHPALRRHGARVPDAAALREAQVLARLPLELAERRHGQQLAA